MNLSPARLILVYNAGSGLFNAAKDAVWKVVSPSSYPCSLCALTYGWLAMHGRWRRFLERVPLARVFHHRDDFTRAFPGCTIAYPAILVDHGTGTPEVLVSAEELNALADLSALIALVEARLAQASG